MRAIFYQGRKRIAVYNTTPQDPTTYRVTFERELGTGGWFIDRMTFDNEYHAKRVLENIADKTGSRAVFI